MLNIIIPMAGPSDEFQKAGYIYPKPLIDVAGRPLIQYVLDSLKPIEQPKKYTFLVRQEDCQKYHIDNTLKLLEEDCTIIKLNSTTKGALCTVLMAIDQINPEDEMLILNSDQILDIDFNDTIKRFREMEAETGIVTFKSVHPRWSYALVQGEEVVQTAEKNPISKMAIAGFYYFKKAQDFFNSAFETILYQDHLNGNYFLSPVINRFVLANRVNRFIETDIDKFHSFYSPQKIKEFENYVRR